MLLHKKKDKREASSTSLTGCATPARAPGGSLSIRYKKYGLERTRATPARIPSSKLPPLCLRPLVKRQRRLDVRCSDRTPIRPACEIGEDLYRAGGLIRSRTCGGRLQCNAFGRNAADTCARMAHKEPLPAGPFAQAVHVVRAVDGHGPQLRHACHHWTSWLSRLDGSQTSCNWAGRSFHVKPTS